VSSLSLLDDSQSSCRSGADGPSSFVWACMPDGPTTKQNQLVVTAASVHPNHFSDVCTCTLILYIFAATCMEGSQLLCVSASANSQPTSGQLSSQCQRNMVILDATINPCEPLKQTDHNRFSVLLPWCDNITIHNQHQPTFYCQCA
jgi:hypothetical protein